MNDEKIIQEESLNLVSELHPLIEYVVFVNLNKESSLELILLKGHIILESILTAITYNKHSQKIKNYSFYKRITDFEKLKVIDESEKYFIVTALKDLNNMRNKLAHEISFKMDDNNFEIWAINILDTLKGEKFSKYTKRTKIIHSFSFLSKHILNLKIKHNL